MEVGSEGNLANRGLTLFAIVWSMWILKLAILLHELLLIFHLL